MSQSTLSWTWRGAAALLLSTAVAGCSLDAREPGLSVPPQVSEPGGGVPPGADGPVDMPTSGSVDADVAAATPVGPSSTSRVATRLSFQRIPATGLVGSPLSPFTVRIENDDGDLVVQEGDLVFLTMSGGPSEAEWLGFESVTARGGIATFDTVGIDRPGTYQLTAGCRMLRSESAGIEVTAPAFINVATNIPELPVFSVLAATHEILYASTDRGIFRSDNTGASWTLASFGSSTRAGTLRANPSAPDVVYAARGDNEQSGIPFLSRTLNRGETWRSLRAPVFDTPVHALAFDEPRNIVWACGDSGVYVSRDRGEQWEATAFEGECGALVFGGPAPPALYAYHADGPTRTLLTSRNDGGTWQTLLPLPNALSGLVATSSGALFMTSQVALQRSDDGGASWSSTPVNVTHPVISPADPQRIYALSDKLVRVSTDGGATFDEGVSMNPNQVYDLAVDPTDAQRVYAATSAGLRVSVDGGANWGPTSTGLAGTTDVVVHPTLPGRVLAAGRRLYESDDFGDSWSIQDNGPPFVTRIAFHPDDPNVAYTCGPDFYESRNGGASWAQLATPFGCEGLAIAGSTIWMATIDQGVQRSPDGGLTWSQTTLDLPTYSVAGDPNGTNVYAATNAGTFRSTDAGNTWTPMVSTDRAEALALDPARASRVWAAVCLSSPGPVRFSVNSGDTWSTPAPFDALDGGCAFDAKFAASGALYVLGTELHLSRDAGTTWTSSPASGIATFLNTRLAISPDETTFFVATERGLFRSRSTLPR